jgi:pyruvate/2-oxoglutarate dehydrogenase complex dihydrolipoamide acyltransferase (E2) component
MSCSLIATINKAIKAPVVENDELKVGEVMNCNFLINHQYVDGANIANVASAFRRVFEQP